MFWELIKEQIRKAQIFHTVSRKDELSVKTKNFAAV